MRVLEEVWYCKKEDQLFIVIFDNHHHDYNPEKREVKIGKL